MSAERTQAFYELLDQVTGYIYPNEIELHWSILIVVYPYVTGLVAGAFILASLVKVFKIKEVEPTYRLSLLTALAFLLVAPLPLLFHLGRPERSFEIFLTPNLRSAMAMFGFVYAWYLMAVLLLELWFEYRSDLVILGREKVSRMAWIYRALSLFSTDISEAALAFDRKAIRAITIVGIPSAFLLHGYVGFIFGSVKANPWWSSVLMPIVFLMSAIVSGIALVVFL
jgi:Ni/Fe-hydrogenase subunit HybB-like protein